MGSSTKEGAVPLYDYQRAWLADRSRFKVGRWSRQAGKSFASSLEAVLDLAEKETRGERDQWIFLSKGERQSRELVGKAKMHAEALDLAASEIGEEYFRDLDCRLLHIDFPGGSRIIGLPPTLTRPAAGRGTSCSTSSRSTPTPGPSGLASCRR